MDENEPLTGRESDEYARKTSKREDNRPDTMYNIPTTMEGIQA